MNLFYAMFVAVMGMITSMLFVRVWRTVSAELFERNILGNRWVSPLVLVLIMLFLAFTGSWVNLWLLFILRGSEDQPGMLYIPGSSWL